MSETLSEQVLRDLTQSFGTTITPDAPEISPVSFLVLPAEYWHRIMDDREAYKFKELLHVDGWRAPFTSTFEDFDDEGIAWELRQAIAEAIWRQPEIAEEMFCDAVFEADIPVRMSPLKGVSLNSLLSGTGPVVIVTMLFEEGVTKATLGLIFMTTTIIVVGIADAVRKATSDAIEDKLRACFGRPKEQEAATKRLAARKKKSESKEPDV